MTTHSLGMAVHSAVLLRDTQTLSTCSSWLRSSHTHGTQGNQQGMVDEVALCVLSCCAVPVLFVFCPSQTSSLTLILPLLHPLSSFYFSASLISLCSLAVLCLSCLWSVLMCPLITSLAPSFNHSLQLLLCYAQWLTHWFTYSLTSFITHFITHLLLFPLHSILLPSLAFKPSLYCSSVTLPHNFSIFLPLHSTPFLSIPLTLLPAWGVVCCCDVLCSLHRNGMVSVTRVSTAHGVVFSLLCAVLSYFLTLRCTLLLWRIFVFEYYYHWHILHMNLLQSISFSLLVSLPHFFSLLLCPFLFCFCFLILFSFFCF